MSRCASCHAEFLPRPGPCPRCGSPRVEPIALSAAGVVKAATELSATAAGWTAPHHLALVELADGIRVLCVVGRTLPAPGDPVQVVHDGEIYRI